MKRVACVLFLVSACCSSRDIDKSIVAQARDRNVWVSNNRGTSCAGVVYSTGLVITAKHCNGDVLEVNGQAASVVKIGTDDLLLVSTQTPEWPSLILNTDPKQGETVFAVGNQAGYADFFSQGHVARVTEAEKDDPARIWTEGVVAVPGVSGAALFDANGHLVGINVEIIGTILPNGANAPVCGRSVPASAIKELLQ